MFKHFFLVEVQPWLILTYFWTVACVCVCVFILIIYIKYILFFMVCIKGVNIVFSCNKNTQIQYIYFIYLKQSLTYIVLLI